MDGMQWLAGALHAARARLDVATDNIANVSSDDFQKTYARAIASARGIDVFTARAHAQGPLVHTGQRFDVALLGPGALAVRDAQGAVEQIRGGHLERDAAGYLTDARGRRLLSVCGHAVAVSALATIDENGAVHEGSRITERLSLTPHTTLHAGFVERPAVDAIAEMVGVLDAQRSFETAQKVLMTIDDVRGKATNDVGRLK